MEPDPLEDAGQGVADIDDADIGDVAPRLPGPAYPLQPEDAERPVPMRAAPDRTQDPDDWDVESTEPSSRRRPDEVVAQRQADEEEARRSGGDGPRRAALDADVEQESGYSTEIDQGAAPPRPAPSEEDA